MAKLNHNRPHLKIVDNLRRILAASDSNYKSNQMLDDSTSAKTTRKKCVQIKFHGNELKLCQALLDSIELYYSDFEIFLSHFMTKPKNHARYKIKLEQSEANLRTCIREFFAEYVIIKIKKNEKSYLPTFWKLLEKELKKSGDVYDVIADEVKNLGALIESGCLDKRLGA